MAAGLFALLFLSFAIGGRVGSVHVHDEQNLGVIQGATLGLIGLLMGFCFAGAMSRFVDRQDIVVQEANAIGTIYLRADLLDAGPGERMRGELKSYTLARLALSDANSSAEEVQANQKLNQAQAELWATATQAVKDRPAITLAVLNPMNELFDLLGTRNAAAHRHLPKFALVLVFFATMLGASLLGYGQSGKRLAIRLSAMTVVVLLGSILWAIVDLDFPQRGLIQINMTPLHDVVGTMK